MKNNGIIDVIEKLLEADMTEPDKIKNPQEEEMEESKKMLDDDAFTYKIAQAAIDGKKEIELDGETHPVDMDIDQAKKIVGEMKDMEEMDDESVEEAQEVKNQATDSIDGATAKPSSDNEKDNSGEVLGSETGTAQDAGGDQDVGGSKGDNPSDAADNSSEVLGSESGTAQDAGGDKDEGVRKTHDQALPSDASSSVEADKGPHTQASDTGLGEEVEEEEAEEVSEADQDTTIEKGANEKENPIPANPIATPSAEVEADKADHDQSSDPVETPTDANPKGVAESEEETEESEEEVSEAAEEETEESEEEVSEAAACEDCGKVHEGQCNEETDDLEEEFKQKAAIVFETAVNEKANLIREDLEKEYEEKLSEELEQVNVKISEYVDYAVQEWINENQLEIKYSLRTEIAENFIKGLKGLFEESYIEIPEEEFSVVDELTEEVESTKEQLEETSNALAEAQKEILQIRRQEIVNEEAEGLTETQKIRLEKLSESVEAEDIDEFRFKVEQLKESYFDPTSEQPLLNSLSDEVYEGVTLEEDGSTVSQYAKFLSKTVQK